MIGTILYKPFFFYAIRGRLRQCIIVVSIISFIITAIDGIIGGFEKKNVSNVVDLYGDMILSCGYGSIDLLKNFFDISVKEKNIFGYIFLKRDNGIIIAQGSAIPIFLLSIIDKGGDFSVSWNFLLNQQEKNNFFVGKKIDEFLQLSSGKKNVLHIQTEDNRLTYFSKNVSLFDFKNESWNQMAVIVDKYKKNLNNVAVNCLLWKGKNKHFKKNFINFLKTIEGVTLATWEDELPYLALSMKFERFIFNLVIALLLFASFIIVINILLLFFSTEKSTITWFLLQGESVSAIAFFYGLILSSLLFFPSLFSGFFAHFFLSICTKYKLIQVPSYFSDITTHLPYDQNLTLMVIVSIISSFIVIPVAVFSVFAIKNSEISTVIRE